MSGRLAAGDGGRGVDARLRAGAVTLAVLIAVALVALALPRALSTPSHRLTVVLPSASGLVQGSDVLEAGARAGSVATITPQRDGTARIDVDISGDHWPLHRGLTVDIRPKSLLGEEYVDIHDGPAGSPPYDASVAYHGPVSADPVQLDQLLNSLDPATRTAARALLDDLGAGVAGQGANLNAAIAASRGDLTNLAVTGRTLQGRDADLDRIILGLDGVLQKITSGDQLAQLSQLIGNGQSTLDSIETQRAAFSRSFSDAAVALGELNTAVDSAVPSLRTTVDAAPALLTSLGQESDLLAYLGAQINQPGVLPNLVAGIQRGPLTTGGALETEPNGQTNSIFRICFVIPVASSSCSGQGTPRPAGTQGAGPGSLATSLIALMAP